MNLRLLIAFAGGVLLALVAFYLVSGPPGGELPAEIRPAPAVPSDVPAVADPPIAPAPPPAAAPVPKRKAVRVEKQFVPSLLLAKAVPSPEPPVIADQPPELAPVTPSPELPAADSALAGLAAPSEPRVLTIPEKTAITIRLGERLASDRSVPGDAFFGSLDASLVVDGWVIAERGARVIGRVTDVEAAGRVKGIATLTIELSSVTASDGQRIPVRTARFVYKGDTSKKDDAVRIGIGSVIGAAIGAAAGGGKGAAIGAASGAAAGAGAVALTRGKAAVIEPETRISFQLERAVTITERL